MAESANRQKEIFLSALDLPPAQRTVFLAQACGDDKALRGQVEALLAAQGTPDSFLEKPAAVLEATIDATTGPDEAHPVERQPPSEPGLRIGPYKLLEQIGEGGMGVVYMAEQQAPVRRMVALKIIKPGMDSAQVLARFEAERQALALMDHPNIAKVHDAGTTSDGRPYFVMELIKGTPITAFCDANGLAPQQRLELFVFVCQAIQHAHQKGVIHRDIKPSNVLIALYDDRPVPKVIDFGIARATGQALTERTLHTGFGAIVGTPEYMSPEQATFNQLDIDTRSDVYSLGVLLYELLTGTTPVDRSRFQEAVLLEVLRVVREEEPPRPSAKLSTAQARASIAAARGTAADRLVQMLRGELDWIVMKALEKDRNRRYETAASLAHDVERYLKDELVEARPPSLGYRLRKFARKHRGPVVAASLVLLTLIGGVIGTTLAMLRAWDAEAAESSLRKTADGLLAQALEATGRAEASEKSAKESQGEAEANAISARKAQQEAEQNAAEATQQRLRAETALYATLIDQARRACEANDTAEANRILDSIAEPFQKAWETRHLRDLSRRKAQPLGSYREFVAWEWSFDGNVPRIVSLAQDGFIQTWDHAAGSFQRLSRSVNMAEINLFQNRDRLALSRDGQFVAEGAFLGTVKIWPPKDKPDRTPFKVLDGLKMPARQLAFSPDGRHILASAERCLVWEVATGEEKFALKDARGAWMPDGRLVYAAEGGLWIRNLAEGTSKQVGENVAGAHEPWRVNLRCSANGKRLAASSGQDLSVSVWDLQTWQKLRTFNIEKQYQMSILTVAISGNGRYVAAFVTNFLGVRKLLIWDTETGQSLANIPAHPLVTSLALGDDGTRFLTGSHANCHLWNLTASHESFLLNQGNNNPVLAVAVDHTGDGIVSGGWHGKVFVWDGKRGKLEFAINLPSKSSDHVRGLAIDPGGRTLYLGAAGPLRVWDRSTQRELYQCVSEGHSVFCAMPASDGRRVFAGCSDGLVRVLDLVKRCPESALAGYKRHGWIGTLSLSADARRFAVCGEPHSGSRMVGVFESDTGRDLLTFDPKHIEVNSIALSPDGQFLVTGGRDVQEPLKVWEVPSGRLKFILRGHTDTVSGVAVTPDGQRTISTSSDGTVRFWDAATGVETLRLKNLGSRIAVSGDSRRIVCAGGSGVIPIWDAP